MLACLQVRRTDLISEVKQTQFYDARLCTNNQEKTSQTKNKLPKQLVGSVGCRYGVQRVLLNLTSISYRTGTNFPRKPLFSPRTHKNFPGASIFSSNTYDFPGDPSVERTHFLRQIFFITFFFPRQ